MAYAPVADEADSERAMLNDSFVTPLDNASDKLLCASVRDFVLGLVASTPSSFDGGQKGLIFGSVDKLHRRLMILMFYTPATWLASISAWCVHSTFGYWLTALV